MAPDNELIVSVSGIRGVVGSGLTPEAATAFASALGTITEGGRIVLGRDGRPSGLMVRHAVLAGLFAAGCDVLDLGVVPTPTCGLALRRLRASGGIQITASHNPAPWNGLKLFGSDGTVLPAAQGQRIQQLFTSRAFRRVPWNELGQVTAHHEAASWHSERVLQLIDVTKIAARRFKVLVDGNGGAGGPLSRLLLESLGCQSTYHACEADGKFRHEPEPTEENVRAIGPLIAQHKADIGFILDPDSDRLALLDETGRYIGEELTLALSLWFRLGQQRGPVVINMSSSRLCEDIAGKFDSPCYRSAVGEANVVEKMRAVGAVIGGEGNGGVIDPRVGWVRDPFIGMGLILNWMADSGRKLSDLVAELPVYTIVKDRFTLERGRLPGLFSQLVSKWSDAKINQEDGLRLDWNDRWLHVRPSNTEPIVRVIAEAPRGEDARQMCQEVARMIKAG